MSVIFQWLAARIMRWAKARPPNFVIGSAGNPYLIRWFLIPRNPVFNIYVHQFMRSDDDRALHDHPWTNLSILLGGRYIEHTISAGGINMRREYAAGAFKFRWRGGMAHRLELIDGACWTIFITGPRYRQWGFHCQERGWVHWKDFTAANNVGEVGKGCDQ